MLEMGISESAAADAVRQAIRDCKPLSNVLLESPNGKTIRLSELAEIKELLSHGRCFRRWCVNSNGHWREQPWLNFTSGRKPKVKVIDTPASKHPTGPPKSDNGSRQPRR